MSASVRLAKNDGAPRTFSDLCEYAVTEKEDGMKKYYDDGASYDDLRAAADAARAKGTLDDASLEAFYRKVSPYLTAEQAARLRAMVDSLKTGE